MAFQVPASKASFKQNRFEFQFPGEKKKYSIPLLSYIKPELGLAMAAVDGGSTKDAQEGIQLLFEHYFPGENLFSKFDDNDQFLAWVNAWQEASGISVGESSASPDSSTSTARLSDTTSSQSDEN